jgi:putative ABC transport system permease protein
MKLWRLIRQGFLSLGSHKLRSFFMMIGTLLGVASLTVVTGLNEGARARLEQRLEGFGAKGIRVRAGGGRQHVMGMRAATMKLADVQAIRAGVPGLDAASGLVRIMDAKVRVGGQNRQVMVYGGEVEFARAFNDEVLEGRWFTRDEVQRMSRVCLLGPRVRSELFGDGNPLGRRLTINRVSFQVIGLLDERGVSPRGDDLDDRIVIPISTAMKRLAKQDFIHVMVLQSQSEELLETQVSQITDILRRRHHITPPEEDDFMIITATRAMNFRMQAMGSITLLLGALTILSLIVGGVVLMNIMLVSVSERTREIGLRRALGASSRDVYSQFLAEAVIVTGLGLLGGTLLGLGIFAILRTAIPQMPLAFSPSGFAVAALSSGLVGVVFGSFPSKRAARLMPVEALR